MSNQEDSIFNTVKSTLDFFNNQISTIKTSYVTLATAQSISGVKTFTGGLVIRGGDEGIAVNSDDSYLELCGGSENSTGAWLDLYGSENANEGAFKLAACDGTTTIRLVGSADGSLTWGGNDLVLVTGAQTISGVKTFTSGIVVHPGGNSIVTSTDSSFVEICAGTDNTHGAFIELYGDEYATASTLGAFRIGASDGTNTKRLIGLPDGTLTWDGNPVVVDHNGYTANGNIYCANPSDPDEDSTMVATTSWVQDLVQSSGSQLVIDSGRREVWTVSTASASGDAITLPNSMSYVVGSNRLLVVVNGVVLMPTYNYTEVGSSGDTATTITMLMPLAVGDEVMAWTVPVCASGSGLSSVESRLSALESVITDLSTESF